jgi:GNAT superfamily N-acetyltransferase
MPIFADLQLARRLERTEAKGNAMFVEARARVSPESKASWIECGGAYGMFDGPESPLTQTFGLGVFEEASDTTLETFETFFKDRGAPVFHETSPIAGPLLLELLNKRGYQPIEYSTVLFREIGDGVASAPDPAVRVRIVDAATEGKLWADTAARGWASEQPALMDFIRELGTVNAARARPLCFLGEIDGVPGATGDMSIHEGVALFAGASTVPEMRRRGLQYALLAARMQYAKAQGCDLAMMCAAPGSASQRNAERHGFRIAYTRVKWQLRSSGGA